MVQKSEKNIIKGTKIYKKNKQINKMRLMPLGACSHCVDSAF